jgi:hypothetical protein
MHREEPEIKSEANTVTRSLYAKTPFIIDGTKTNARQPYEIRRNLAISVWRDSFLQASANTFSHALFELNGVFAP